jgi:hypothetical protein
MEFFCEAMSGEMGTSDPQAAAKVQMELMSGENLYWAGMPNRDVVFHSDDWTLVPFSLLWGRICDFLGSGRNGLLGQRLAGRGRSAFHEALGNPFCGGRAIHDLGPILVRRVAEEADVLCGDEQARDGHARRMEAENEFDVP